MFSPPTVTAIALQTSTFVVATSIGVVLSIPEHAPVRLLTDQTAAGALMRRVLPAVIVVPIVYYPFSKTVWMAFDRAVLQQLG